VEELNNREKMIAIAKPTCAPLINTPLQRGEKMRERGKNRFNGFLSEW
jgi:hypothetical protein